MALPGILGRLIGRHRKAAPVIKFEATPDPLHHDSNGAKGGSLPAKKRGLDELRAELEAKGGKVNRNWGAKRLQAEIDARK